MWRDFWCETFEQIAGSLCCCLSVDAVVAVIGADFMSSGIKLCVCKRYLGHLRKSRSRFLNPHQPFESSLSLFNLGLPSLSEPHSDLFCHQDGSHPSTPQCFSLGSAAPRPGTETPAGHGRICTPSTASTHGFGKAQASFKLYSVSYDCHSLHASVLLDTVIRLNSFL